MKKSLKRILISLSILLALFILLLIGTVTYLKTPQAQRLIQAKVNESIPGHISWKEFDFSLLAGRFEIKNAMLKGPSDDQLIAFDSLFLNLDWSSLFKGELAIETFTLERPQIWLMIDRKGGLNISKAFPPSGKTDQAALESSSGRIPLNILIDKFELIDGEFQYEIAGKLLRDESKRVVAQDIDLTLNQGNLLEQSVQLMLQIGGGEIDMAGIKTALDVFRLKASLEQGQVKPLEVILNTNVARVRLTGEINDAASKPLLNLDVNFETSLDEIQKTLGLETEISGPVQFLLKAEGKAENPVADLNLTYGGGTLAGNAVDKVELRCRLEDRLMAIKGLDINAPVGDLHLEGQIDLKKAFPQGFLSPPDDLENITYHLNLAHRGTDLKKLANNNLDLSGTVRSNLDLEGKGISLNTLTVKGLFTLFAEKLAYRETLAPVNVDLSTQIGMNNGIAEIRDFDLKTAETHLLTNMKYHLSSQKIDGKVDLRIPDLPALLSPLGIKDLHGKTALRAGIGGTVNQPQADLRLQGNGMAFQEIAIGDIQLNVALDQSGMIKISTLSLENQGSQIRGNGTIQLFKEHTNLDPDFPSDISLTFKNLEAKDFMDRLDYKGTLDGDLSIKGKLMSPRVGLGLVAKSLAMGVTRIGDVNADVSFADGVVTIDPLKLRNKQSRLMLTGTAKVLDQSMKLLKDPEFHLKLDDTALFLNDFMDNLKGKLQMVSEIQGKMSAPTCILKVTGESLEVGKNRIGDLEAALQFADGIVRLDRVKLHNGQSDLNLTGEAHILDKNALKPLKDPSFDLKLTEGSLNLSDFADTLKGKLSLKALVQGTRSTPIATISAQGEGLEAGGFRVGNLNAHLRFSDGTLSLNPVKISNRKSVLNISGTALLLEPESLKLTRNPVFDLTLSGEQLFLQDFLKGMKGKLALKGRVKGSITHPKGNITVNGKNMDLGMQKIHGLQMVLNMDGKKIHLQSLDIALDPKEKLQVKGMIYPQKKEYDLQIKSQGISFKNIGPIQGQDLGQGKIFINLSGKGNFDNPGLKGDIWLRELRLKDSTLDDVRLAMDLKDHLARISGKLNFDFKASYNLKSKDFAASTYFQKTDLTPYFRVGKMEDMSGTITGMIEARGNVGAPDKIHAIADMSQLEIFRDKMELVQARAFKAVFQNQEISIPGIHLTLLKQGHMDIKGHGKLGGTFDIKLDGNIPLEVLRGFSEDFHDASGGIKLSGILRGSLARPDLTANITLDKLHMSVPGLSQKLHDFNGRIRMTSDSVSVDNLVGNLDNGRFELSGTIGLSHFTPTKARIKIRAHMLPVKIPDTLDVLLNTDLSIRGTSDKSVISGEILLLEGVYFKDVEMNLLKMVGEKKRKEAPPPSGPSNPFLKNINLDIALKHRNPFLVDNNMVLMSLKPTLRVYGTLDQPLISGRAEVESGTIAFQKKEFEVKKGLFDFLNPYKIEPTIALESEAEIRKWIIFLAVSGTPDNLKLELTSDPPEQHGDILSLLALGKTTQELINNEGGTSTPTSQLVADIVAATVQEGIKDATGLDIVELKYREGEDENETGSINVTVGKELSRRITVKYGLENKDGETIQKATTEYKFLEQLLLNAFQDTGGNYGGELIFRLEFQ